MPILQSLCPPPCAELAHVVSERLPQRLAQVLRDLLDADAPHRPHGQRPDERVRVVGVLDERVDGQEGQLGLGLSVVDEVQVHQLLQLDVLYVFLAVRGPWFVVVVFVCVGCVAREGVGGVCEREPSTVCYVPVVPRCFHGREHAASVLLIISSFSPLVDTSNMYGSSLSALSVLTCAGSNWGYMYLRSTTACAV